MGKALLIVDVQNDFTPPEGALAVPGGHEVIPRINELASSDEFDLVVATRDWHPPDHSSFEDQGGPWPVHCVRETEGAQLDPKLDHDAIDVVIDKGQARDRPGYSAFERPELDELLRERDIDELTMVGLATDICVKNTALDAARAGYQVKVDPEASRGVNEQDSREALREIEQVGGHVASSREA